MVKNKPDQKMIWMVSSFVLGALFILSFFVSSFGIEGVTGGTTKASLESQIEAYLENSIGGDVEILEVEKVSGVYKIKFKVNDEENEIFVTKDGKLMFLNFVGL
tara:strand:- start:191 stop:502 length:312 start_codon:yes stop_codon:yes gene_type:complete